MLVELWKSLNPIDAITDNQAETLHSPFITAADSTLLSVTDLHHVFKVLLDNSAGCNCNNSTETIKITYFIIITLFY